MTRRSAAIAAAMLVASLVHATIAAAQMTEPDASKARVRVGPVLFNPTVELSNVGIDTNVFNEPSDRAKRDVTLTFSPKTDLWMKMARTWVVGNVREDVVWFKDYVSERSTSNTVALGWLVPLTRVAFSAGGTYRNVRDRPGYEIDTRARRTDLEAKGSAELRALSRTFVGVRGSRRRLDFDADAVFRNASLRTELNRTATEGALTVRHQLTPLTAITLDVGRIEERFEFSPLRNSNSTTTTLGVSLDPAALIKGSAKFGYRDFQPQLPGLPEFRGATVAVDLSYTLLDITRFAVRVGRDVAYSYDVNQPYYLETGVSGSIAQQIFGPVDFVGRAGFQTLDYRNRTDVLALLVDRTDKVHFYGGGVGYHMRPDVRIGVNADRQRRTSEVARHEYEGVRLGVAITYGF